MTALRNTSLRRIVALLFLISGLSVQVQTLFACQLMDDGPKTTCCCDEHKDGGCAMGGGCDSTPGSMATDCCDVTVDVDMQDMTVAATTAAKLITHLDAPQPPPAAPVSTELKLTLPNHPVHPHPHDYSLSGSPGTQTYLVTNRFRL